jgi:solute carrier family 13 (sodium-dependent dicarboxylate transporter), member 2/3/5
MKKETTRLITLAAALLLFIIVILSTGNQAWELRSGLGIILTGIFLWVTEPIPMPLTALLITAALVISGAVQLEPAVSGFATGAFFLIMAGFFMAKGVNNTDLVKRFSYYIIIRFGGTVKGSILAVLLIMQAMAFFIPAIAVKAALLLPIIITINETLPENAVNSQKVLLLTVAFGASITSVGLLPAAIANVLTAELITGFTGQPVTYFQWMIYNLPLSLILIPLVWQILLKVFPPDANLLPGGIERLQRELDALGPITAEEIRCLAILFLTIILWMTEGIHGWHSAVPALLAAVLMGFPGIGITDWKTMSDINWGAILLVGTNISLGKVLMVTGISAFLATNLFPSSLAMKVLGTPVIAVAFLAVFTQLYHLFIGNVATLVISILPIILELSKYSSLEPMLLGFVISSSALCGFVLVVQTLPNIIVYSTGQIQQKDFIRSGLPITIVTVLAIIAVSYFWWPIAGRIL